MIAVIAANRSDNPLVKTTLILAPVALLEQWQLEVEMKTNLALKCLIYHGMSLLVSMNWTNAHCEDPRFQQTEEVGGAPQVRYHPYYLPSKTSSLAMICCSLTRGVIYPDLGSRVA